MNPPTYETLIGNLSGLYSRRINIQHRLVYQVIELPDRPSDEASIPGKRIDDINVNDEGNEPKEIENERKRNENTGKQTDPESAAPNEEGIVKVLRIWSRYDGLK